MGKRRIVSRETEKAVTRDIKQGDHLGAIADRHGVSKTFVYTRARILGMVPRKQESVLAGLSPQQVWEIGRRLDNDETYGTLANEYGVSRVAICIISRARDIADILNTENPEEL